MEGRVPGPMGCRVHGWRGGWQVGGEGPRVGDSALHARRFHFRQPGACTFGENCRDSHSYARAHPPEMNSICPADHGALTRASAANQQIYGFPHHCAQLNAVTCPTSQKQGFQTCWDSSNTKSEHSAPVRLRRVRIIQGLDTSGD